MMKSNGRSAESPEVEESLSPRHDYHFDARQTANSSADVSHDKNAEEDEDEDDGWVECPHDLTQEEDFTQCASLSWRRAKRLAGGAEANESRERNMRQLNQAKKHETYDEEKDSSAQDTPPLSRSWLRIKHMSPGNHGTETSAVAAAQKDSTPTPSYYPAVDESALDEQLVSAASEDSRVAAQQWRDARVAAKMAGLNSNSVLPRKEAWNARGDVAALRACRFENQDDLFDVEQVQVPAVKPPPRSTPGAFAVNRVPSRPGDLAGREQPYVQSSLSHGDNSRPAVMDADVEPIQNITTTTVFDAKAEIWKGDDDGLSLTTRITLAIAVVVFVGALVLVTVLVADANSDGHTNWENTTNNNGRGIRPFATREEFLDGITDYLRDPSPNSNAATTFGYPIGSWDVSRIEDFSDAFDVLRTDGLSESFNDDITAWDMRNAEKLVKMFFGAKSFNQPIGKWNLSAATTLSSMFYGASSFNQSIGEWNVSSCKRMHSMFRDASSFNQPLGNWTISSVETLKRMFQSATSFNQPLDEWDTSSVVDMSEMFYGATTFNQPIGRWNTKSVTDISEMFREATSFNQPLDRLDMSSVKDMGRMFDGASKFDQNLCLWGASLLGSDRRAWKAFRDTSCPTTDDPQQICRTVNEGTYFSDEICSPSPEGPFCHVCTTT